DATPLFPPAGGEPNQRETPIVSETPAFGAGGNSTLMNPLVGHVPYRMDVRTTWFPDERVTNGPPAQLGYVQQDFSVAFPLWQNETNEVSATAHVRGEFFHTGAVFLPDTGQAFPSELWNVHVGATYRHLFDNGWIAGGGVNVGSASDRPFSSIHEMTAGVN